ncbi:hypothetical protein Trydic_g9922 [Trypoxylus dichotomus]
MGAAGSVKPPSTAATGNYAAKPGSPPVARRPTLPGNPTNAGRAPRPPAGAGEAGNAETRQTDQAGCPQEECQRRRARSPRARRPCCPSSS